MDLLPGSQDALVQQSEVPDPDMVLADAGKLVTDGRYVEAADMLTNAVSVNGPSVRLLRELASVEQLQGHHPVALALLHAARCQDRSDLDVVCDYADLLEESRCFGDALTVYCGLAETDRQDPKVRGGLGRLQLAMGLQALAVDSFGDPRDLAEWERSLRRRAWWRTGGPLWFLRRRRRRLDQKALSTLPPPPAEPRLHEQSDLGSTLALVRELADEDRVAAPAVTRARQLVGDDRPIEAADALAQVLPAAKRNVELLRMLARVERQLGHDRLALALLEVAAGVDDLDVWTKADQARALVGLRRFQQATTLLTELSEPVRQDQKIRTALAEVYQAMGLRALALDAYGGRRRLWRYYRATRRRLWWATGGPLWFVRRRRRRLDNQALRSWPADPSAPAGEPSDATALANRVRELLAEDRRVDSVLRRVRELTGDGEWAAATAELASEVAANGPNAALLYQLAWAELAQGHDRAALVHLERSRKLDPSNLQSMQDQV